MGIQDREYYRRWLRGDSQPKRPPSPSPPSPRTPYRPRAAPPRTPSTPGYLVRQQREQRRRRNKFALLFVVLLAIAAGIWALNNYGVLDALFGGSGNGTSETAPSSGDTAATDAGESSSTAATRTTGTDSTQPSGTDNTSPSSQNQAGSTPPAGNDSTQPPATDDASPNNPNETGSTPAGSNDNAVAPPAEAEIPPPAECPDPAEVATSADSTAIEPPASGIEGGELSSLRQLVLDLTNSARRSAGLQPVRLGANLAPQEHAEDMAEHCFLSHWGTTGLKPYMRYSLAGGVQANAENVSGSSFCPDNPSRYAQKPLPEKAREAFEGLMNSPGHRANILRPQHRVLHLGMAYRAPNFWLVQHFSGRYAAFAQLPEIANGRLSFDMSACNGAQISNDDLSVQVRYDPLPAPLTPGQLQRTSCYSKGGTLAQLRPPIRWPRSWFMSYDERDWFLQTGSECLDPRTLSRALPPAQSYEEAASLKDSETSRLLALPEIGYWITADQWDVDDGNVRVTADLSTLSRLENKGVYTIVIWGTVGGERVPIAEYSIIAD